MEEIKKIVKEYFESQDWKGCYSSDKDAYEKCLYNNTKREEEYKKYKVIRDIKSFCIAIKSGIFYIYKNGTRFDNCIYMYFDIEGNDTQKEFSSPGYEFRVSFNDIYKCMFIKEWNGNNGNNTNYISLPSVDEITNKLLEIYNQYVLNNEYIVVVNRPVAENDIGLEQAREFLLECKEIYADKL